MIRANCLFYEVTEQPKYLAEAQRIARAAEVHWVDRETGAVRDAGRFAHMLVEAFLAVRRQDGDPHWLRLTTKTVAYVHGRLRDAAGRCPARPE